MKEAEIAGRNLRIVLARQREVLVKPSAAQCEISERQVCRIAEDWNKRGT
jgi:hypothetical protein